MSSRNICIVGPRASGKTTYLAALAYHAEHKIKHHKKSQYTVTPVGRDSKILQDKAKVLLREGGEFEATKITEVDKLPFYQFTITGKLNWRSPEEAFNLTTRDYPGEAFHYLVEGSESEYVTPENEEFLKDCVTGLIEDCFTDKKGCVMMLPGWEMGDDEFYKEMLQRFIEEMDLKGQTSTYKMAVVMSKCERGEIWPGRLEPELDLFSLHLKETTKYLRKTLEAKNLAFFAISTFGVRGKNPRNDPRPNRRDFITAKGEPASALYKGYEGKENTWYPYNLIEPLYWLLKS